ncbi:DNA-directed RNA polymerase beta subunit [Gregarina niphandrodes]|uniref:DNA-directed RNA polymerase subunit beta n=1 Tax=Gregarina niphandrodes TaxID=110365 RepID=A0A023B2M3_GRENI|nr:DNA-directed RNA polymerase beta subunit [Gregarina niphandrodes]EZG55042.1 DNA-directed RNA polymerase beta subunit [Gregarina niphandrodes]|eukprot:XP_011131809.1 DNA-directed RNA polymerase beta subunit [Gregarina niphandrodes]
MAEPVLARDVGIRQETLRRGYLPHKPTYETPQFNEKFLSATHPHIASFNLFLNHYIKEIPKHLEPVYVDVTEDPRITGLDPHHFPSEYLTVSISRVELGMPRRVDNESHSGSDTRQFPVHARLSHVTYGAPMYISYVWNNSAGKKVKERTVLSGVCPVLVRSDACHLSKLSAFEMARYAGEDIEEVGGYFIVNGNERGVRFVIQQRCNYPIAIKKKSLRDRDVFYTEYAVAFRAARSDGSSTNNIVFYTEDNQCVFRILLNRGEWTCPFWLLLKALFPTCQLKMVKEKLLSLGEDLELESEISNLWHDFIEGDVLHADQDLHEDRHLALLGYQFWDGVYQRLPPGATYATAGRYIIDRYVLVHTESWIGKFETLILMWQKLWCLKRGLIPAENVDSFAFQEVLGPGQLFAAVLKDALWNSLQAVRLAYNNEVREAKLAGDDVYGIIRSESLFEQIVMRTCQGPAKALSFFCATGNIRTYQLDLQQVAGWTITADKLNMNRFIAHFRAIHRGQFFAKMRTTEVRKLVGETWGFVCPVHTPDGPCCGLLLHMSQDAVVVADPPDGRFKAIVIDFLQSQGYQTSGVGRVMSPAPGALGSYPIVVDGEPICRLPRETFDEMALAFKRLKNSGRHGFPSQAELCAFKKGSGAFEGIFLYSFPGRLVRPVRDVNTRQVEWIGTLAQPWLKIACSDKEVEEANAAIEVQKRILLGLLARPENEKEPEPLRYKDLVKLFTEASKSAEAKAKIFKKFGLTCSEAEQVALIQTCPLDYDYVEVSPTSFLSINASFTPLSNHNQSPRNMYQCQMLKQTMGTPFHNICNRTDNKTYRILTPNRPLVRNWDYRRYDFDFYGSGTNAVVAVISYTGFDMEDAMIINKHAMERGAFDGCVYKTKVVDAAPAGCRMIDMRNFVFANRTASGRKFDEGLELDGLPAIGTKLVRGSSLYRVEDIRLRAMDGTADDVHSHAYNDDEEAFVEKVHLTNPDNDRGSRYAATVLCQRALITLRCIRRPILGDKFASRAGQKGILSLLYPPEDLPFSPSGIVPDLVFNPHGFPSRMTIGMVVESMAGKVAAITGDYQSSTPFDDYPRNCIASGTGQHKQRWLDGRGGRRDRNRWIDQCGYNGWARRGNRYLTDTEEASRADVDNPVDFFGKSLLYHGYQYYGNETLYSGIYGCEMQCQIFLGIIYYQRLRHMVSDKWQCRSVGPIDHLTRQPLKGRKRGGGVRLGEMERDALLGHGAAFMLQDRLLNCSDGHLSYVCPKCGSILSPCLDTVKSRSAGGKQKIPICRVCEVPCRRANLPYVFRYISNELASMNIAIALQVTECDREIAISNRPLHSKAAMDTFADMIVEEQQDENPEK